MWDFEMPRYLTEIEAARVLGVELATFRELVRQGKFPAPLALIGKYDAKALDQAADRLSGLGGARNALDEFVEKSVRVHLKGIHRVTKRLSDGRPVTYHYAWRGGPRLQGAPGSPEFIASYHAAHEQRRTPPANIFRTLIIGFRASADYERLAPRTRADYDKLIFLIEKEFAELKIEALEDRRVTRLFLIGATSSPAARGRPIMRGWSLCGLFPGHARAALPITGRRSASSAFITPTARTRSGCPSM